MRQYNHAKIEKKWQEEWAREGLYTTPDTKPGADNFYLLVEFPYPSGNLHVGHWYAFAVPDILARKMRMEGKNVLFPIGFDAFGLPAENAAIKNKLNPREWTYGNIERMKAQIRSMGTSFDWNREVITCDPAYYRWTQWQFLQFFKKGLAYRKETAVNWCPSCKTVLANEQVVGGRCERCDTEVIQKEMLQWNIKITDYADRLIDDLDPLDWPEQIKDSQRNWIGRSEGAEITFKTTTGDSIKVFTTRPDTMFGATYVVVAPEHQLLEAMKESISNWSDVEAYRREAAKKSDLDRQMDTKDKTGVRLEGVRAINPASNEEIPIFVADYVLAQYGTGAIMAVPAHDERDFAFAQKFSIPVTQVIVPCAPDSKNPPKEGMENVTRDTAIVHLKDRSTGKFALLEWHGSLEGITTAIMGGVETGQTPQEAALQEIREEAGIENARIVKEGRWITAAKYCASHKNQNRTAHAWCFIAEVDSLAAQKPIPENEQKLHTLVWVEERDVLNRLTPDHQKQVWRVLHSDEPLTGAGYLMHSGEFNGMDSETAKKAITEKVGGRMTRTYRLRDWIVSRQRYWGVPIPVIHCPTCGSVPVPDEQLPVALPEIEDYLPTGDGKSPLAKAAAWVNTTCPQCGGTAERETDTFDTFVDSSWYFLRYTDPKNAAAFASTETLDQWMPVDLYSGGAEHTTMHVLYSRFWQKALYDLGFVKDAEPYVRRMNRSLIMGPDGQKMSKSRGNVIDPDAVVVQFGADTVRLYLAFIGPYNEVSSYPWNPDGVVGIRRFLERVWRLQEKVSDADVPLMTPFLHRTIKKVSEDITALKFNTAISQMMIFLNVAEKEGLSQDQWQTFLRLLAPFAPHMAEELWRSLDHTESVHRSEWPAHDPAQLIDEEVTIVVQINGKARAQFVIGRDAPEVEVRKMAEKEAAKWLDGVSIRRVVYVPNRLINIVVG